MSPEFTDEQILESLGEAIREHRFDVIPGLLTVLAAQAPEKAQAAMDLMKIGATVTQLLPAATDDVVTVSRQCLLQLLLAVQDGRPLVVDAIRDEIREARHVLDTS